MSRVVGFNSALSTYACYWHQYRQYLPAGRDGDGDILKALAVITFLVAAPIGLIAQTEQRALPAAASSKAGESVSSAAQMPEIKEAKEGEATGGLMSGDKPFSLMVDEEVGELVYTFNEETKELESIQAKRGVVFASAEMTLNSDEFEYKTLNSELIATGKRVVVRLGEIIITCMLFKYNPDTQEGDFSGNPIVYNRDRNGKVTTTAGNRIGIFNVNGKTQMKVYPGKGSAPSLKSSGQTVAPAPAESNAPAPGTRGAMMTLDNAGGVQGAGNVSRQAIPAPTNAKPEEGAAGNKLISVPDMGSDSGAAAAPKANRIDPDNPQDVQSLSQKKKPQ